MPQQLSEQGLEMKDAQSKLELIHVVRRYGPVGGMERYVWELTRQLQQLGHSVTVICERCHVEKPQGIMVHELGEIAVRPRWIASLRFGRRLARWLADNPHPDSLIHSHERLKFNHITTFHGPPFATVYEKPWWRLISLRVAMQLFMERRELTVARYVVPNSHSVPLFRDCDRGRDRQLEGYKIGAVRSGSANDLRGGILHKLVTKSWKKTPYNPADFELPKGFERKKDIVQVTYSANRKEELGSFLNELGFKTRTKP